MCGIVGYAGDRPAAPVLLRALHDLEYRGYDSAGIAVLAADSAEGGRLRITKRQGKIANLEAALGGSEQETGTTGIGHTRWATHGKPSDRNAHPHVSCHGEVVVIHNGIVENYADLRAELKTGGHAFESETDTETIAHLMEDRLNGGEALIDALRVTVSRLRGSHAIVAMSPKEPGVMVAARIGNAGGVVVGYGDGEMVLASDLAAILPLTQRMAFLEDGHLARVDRAGAAYVDVAGATVDLQPRTVPIDPVSALKGEYEHFMLKEIMEQPESLSDTIRSLVTMEPPEVHLEDLGEADAHLASIRRVIVLGMGTSYNAAAIGRRYFEDLARVPAEVDNASEFRYRNPVIGPDTLVVTVSQSGETVDVLEAMNVARNLGALQVTICNTEGGQTTRVADGTVYTRAGLERCVASTKCFTTALVALYALALRLGEARGVLSREQVATHIAELVRLPDVAARVLRHPEQARALAARYVSAQHVLFLGRGLAYPTAMEGAMKMKETSYIHAEGQAAGEMKHGHIALIDETFPTIAIATKHALRDKLVSNIEQVRARNGDVLAIVTDGDKEVAGLANASISVPEVPELFEPVISTLPLQLLAYYVALERGCDVDQPRNLAKTVTVE